MKFKKWLVAAGLVAGLSVSLAGLAKKAEKTADLQDITIPYTKYVLPNGLTLLVHEDHKAPIAAVNVWYHVGSKDEKEGRTGFAHLFEHLMFNGSENYNDDWFKPFDRVGATGMNGTTNQDRTNYFEVVPKNALDMTLWMESDRMGHLLGAIDQAKLDEQRGVVQNEKRQGENQPYGKVFSTILENVYPKGHPYSHSVIGSMEDLNAATLDDVKEWFNTNYGAANATLVVAGDVDPEEVHQKVLKYFGDIKSGPPLAKQKAWPAKRTGKHEQVMYDRVPQARVYKIWNVPEWGSPEADNLALVASVLSGDKKSRLYKRLVYDEKVASDVDSFSFNSELGGLFGIVATALPGKDLKYIEKAIDEEVAKFIDKGPTKEELKRIKTAYRADFIKGMERVGGFGGKSDILARNQVFANDPHHYLKSFKRIEEAKGKDLVKVADEYLTDGEYQLEVLPFPDYKPVATTVDRSKIPDAGEPPVVKFDKMQKTTLSNGMNVILAQRDAVPVVNFNLLVDSGYAADQLIKPGAANLTMNMLDEGTKNRDALEISGDLAQLGSDLRTGAGLDNSSVSLTTLKENLDKSLDIYGDVILHPAFPEKEFKRLKNQQIASIRQEKSSPQGLGFRVLPKLLYGEGHAYSLPFSGSGDEDSVSSMTREDLKKYYQTWFKPNNATLIVTGDISMDELKPRLEKAFQGWKAGEVPSKKLDAVSEPSEPVIYVIDRPNSQQSMILAAELLPPYGKDNEVALELMNEVLGGSFNSRINMNLREDKHWAYGARSMIFDTQAQRPYLVWAPVQTDKTAEAMAEIQKELTGIIGDKPVTEAEFSRAKDKKVLTLPGRWETARAVGRDIAKLVKNKLPDDYWDKYPQEVRAVNLSEVNAAAKNHVKPGQLTWVVVGDMGKVEDKIRKLGYGKVIKLDKDGNPVKP